MKRRVFLGLSLGVLPAVFAQQTLEIIPLQHTTLDRVLPVLKPLLEPGGGLSGMNNQLFIRASAANRAELKRVLAAIDMPARQLVISVSTQRESEGRNWDTRTVRRDQAEQSVRTMDGSPAFIQLGRSIPIPLRQFVYGPGGVVVSEQVVFQDVGRGFYAEPRLNGRRVTLDIRQQSESMSGVRGAVESQRLSTTVSGNLGEWLPLGGAGMATEGGGAYVRGTQSTQQQVWLKVEEVQ